MTNDAMALKRGEAQVIDWLSEHAAAAGHHFQNDKVLFEHREGDKVTGALVAVFGVAWCFVELLATDPGSRRSGVGRALMARVEEQARQRNMTGVWLDTYTFQAPAFYEALGYQRVGRIDDYPPGEARIFYAKRMDGRPGNVPGDCGTSRA